VNHDPKNQALKSVAGDAVEVWGLKQCGSTRKAMQFLERNKVPYVFRDIREEIPSKTLLREALRGVEHTRKIFNTSGAAYKEGNWKVKVDTLNKEQVIAVLSADSMLIKRPIVRGKNFVTIGYDEDAIANAVQ
jgi:arsenate reductase